MHALGTLEELVGDNMVEPEILWIFATLYAIVTLPFARSVLVA